jgi:serine/threonine protein phosphatase 1
VNLARSASKSNKAVKRFVVGDIHGAHKALLQCFERSGFDPAIDLLISLGDVCDGWHEVHKTIDLLLTLKNFRMIRGNHDEWALKWMTEGWLGHEWIRWGGQGTLVSYGEDPAAVPRAHVELLSAAPYYVEIENKLFVHGGIDPATSIELQDRESLLWDRHFIQVAADKALREPGYRFGKWDIIFLGHTTTSGTEPLRACNVWDLDTGAGWTGKLTIMDIDTFEYWQSDAVTRLYPGHRGRNGS